MRPLPFRIINGIAVNVEVVLETNSTFVFPAFDRTFFTADEIKVIAHTLREEGHRVFYERDLYIEYETVDV